MELSRNDVNQAHATASYILEGIIVSCAMIRCPMQRTQSCRGASIDSPLQANRVMSRGRSASRDNLRLKALLAYRDGVLYAGLVANIHKDETASTVSKTPHSLHRCDGLVDRAIHLKSYFGVLEWRTIFGGYYASDAKNVVVTPPGRAA